MNQQFPARLCERSGKAAAAVLLIIGIAIFFSIGYFVVGPALTKTRLNSQKNRVYREKSPAKAIVKPDISIVETTKPASSAVTSTTTKTNLNQSVGNTGLSTKPSTTASETPFQPSTPKIVEPSIESSIKELWRVQAGVFSDKTDADNLSNKLRASGFQTSIYSRSEGDSKLFIVQVGAFNDKAKAEAMAEKLRAAGFDAQVSSEH